jgi:hypothetical protein
MNLYLCVVLLFDQTSDALPRDVRCLRHYLSVRLILADAKLSKSAFFVRDKGCT